MITMKVQLISASWSSENLLIFLPVVACIYMVHSHPNLPMVV